MIRFNCPHCERPYELPNALAKLPLVCKQCGQRITPPEPTPEPPPPPPASPSPPKPKPLEPKPPLPVKPPEREPAEDEDVSVAPEWSPDIDFNVGGPSAADADADTRELADGPSGNHTRPTKAPATEDDELPDLNVDDLLPRPAPRPVAPWRPPPPPADEPEEERGSGLLPLVADVVVFVLLVLAGLFLGELAVRKPTGAILSEAGSAAKFPPIDLLVWAAPAVVFALIYILLGKREKTVGAWLRRRRDR